MYDYANYEVNSQVNGTSRCALTSPGQTVMVRAMRVMRTMMVGIALITRAGVAQCAWTVSADGTCVQEWTLRDLLRGPAAIVNGPLLPVRTTIGGAEYGWNKKERRWSETWLLGPAVTGASAGAGAFEGLWWVTTGVADLLTGGYFHIAPEHATEISLQPELSTVIAGPPPPPTEDRCGRAVVAAK